MTAMNESNGVTSVQWSINPYTGELFTIITVALK